MEYKQQLQINSINNEHIHIKNDQQSHQPIENQDQHSHETTKRKSSLTSSDKEILIGLDKLRKRFDKDKNEKSNGIQTKVNHVTSCSELLKGKKLDIEYKRDTKKTEKSPPKYSDNDVLKFQLQELLDQDKNKPPHNLDN